jgi:hypothetical protein
MIEALMSMEKGPAALTSKEQRRAEWSGVERLEYEYTQKEAARTSQTQQLKSSQA